MPLSGGLVGQVREVIGEFDQAVVPDPLAKMVRLYRQFS
jgi:hypothetical protein